MAAVAKAAFAAARPVGSEVAPAGALDDDRPPLGVDDVETGTGVDDADAGQPVVEAGHQRFDLPCAGPAGR